MEHELIDRYIYAVTRQLPLKIRADVKLELEGLISDMLEERCGPILPTEKDIRVVLTELGTPTELAAKYSGDEQQSLISGSYFVVYKQVLRIVLPIAAIATALSLVLSTVLDPPELMYMLALTILGQVIGGIIASVFQAFAIITFIFAVLERNQAKLDRGDFFANLPQVPKRSEEIKPYEPIIGIIFSVIGAALFLGIPQILGIAINGSEWYAALNVDVLRSLWPAIVLWAVLGIFKESIKLIEGRYSLRLAIATIALDVLQLACAAFVLLFSDIVNPSFLQFVFGLMNSDGSGIVSLLIASFNVVVFGIVCFALVIECGTVLFKALRKGDKS